MPKRTADEHLTWYVLNYFSQFMTKPEILAQMAFYAKAKGPSFAKILEWKPELAEVYWTTDPDALALMAGGPANFRRHVRDRILREHGDEIFWNRCPKCGGLAKTPQAQQCQWCFHDWHPKE